MYIYIFNICVCLYTYNQTHRDTDTQADLRKTKISSTRLQEGTQDDPRSQLSQDGSRVLGFRVLGFRV